MPQIYRFILETKFFGFKNDLFSKNLISGKLFSITSQYTVYTYQI